MLRAVFGGCLALVAGAVMSTGTAAEPVVDGAKVTGTVTYRERIALPPDAVVDVALLDVSLADAPAEVIDSVRITEPGPVPIAFELSYDPSQIDERHTYAVRAEIRAEGDLIFTTDRSYPVITRGEDSEVDLVLVRVAARTEPDAPLLDTRWKLIQMNGEPVEMPAGGVLHLVLDADKERCHGFAGCNRFSGAYEISGDHLRLGPLAVTNMACPDGMELERAYLTVLDGIDRFVVEGRQLEVYGEGRQLATFQAAYVK